MWRIWGSYKIPLSRQTRKGEGFLPQRLYRTKISTRPFFDSAPPSADAKNATGADNTLFFANGGSGGPSFPHPRKRKIPDTKII